MGDRAGILPRISSPACELETHYCTITYLSAPSDACSGPCALPGSSSAGRPSSGVLQRHSWPWRLRAAA